MCVNNIKTKATKRLFINKLEWEEDSEERSMLVKKIRHYGSKSTRGDLGKAKYALRIDRRHHNLSRDVHLNFELN